jgi:hypothetical protein
MEIPHIQNGDTRDIFGRAVRGNRGKGGKLSIGGLIGFMAFLYLAQSQNMVFSIIMLFVVMIVVDGFLSVVRK